MFKFKAKLDRYYVIYLCSSGMIAGKHIEIKNNEFDFYLIKNDTVLIRYSDISTVWFRRGKLSFNKPHNKISTKKYFNDNLLYNLKHETKGLRDFIFYMLERKKHIGDIEYETNKLKNIVYAQKAGLDIADTYIITNKNILEEKMKNTTLINKSIQKGVFIVLKDDILMNYTTEVTNENIQNVANVLFPTLIQEKIPKKFELRIFYLNNKLYSMAIFSQNNLQTETDFRKYDNSRPNRRVPYNLPKTIEKKLIKFMHLANLTTGSIDMVVDKSDKYIFLEVNPVGQFDMVTHPCNYQIYEKIASNLLVE